MNQSPVRRFPLRSVRTAAVMVTSAFWHGVHSGYYLSIGSCPLVLAVEDLYAGVVRKRLDKEVRKMRQCPSQCWTCLRSGRVFSPSLD